ncbi:MAG: GNAT family N-acetyltransferase, partial [Ilumatobacteraceae bacterium]
MLRPLGLGDADELGRMNSDASVMVHVGGAQDRVASNRSIVRSLANWETYGYGRLAVVRQRDGAFLGWVTIEPADDPTLVGEIEIGWRLMRSAWGEG